MWWELRSLWWSCIVHKHVCVMWPCSHVTMYVRALKPAHPVHSAVTNSSGCLSMNDLRPCTCSMLAASCSGVSLLISCAKEINDTQAYQCVVVRTYIVLHTCRGLLKLWGHNLCSSVLTVDQEISTSNPGIFSFLVHLLLNDLTSRGQAFKRN